MYVIGVWIYLRVTRLTDGIGKRGLLSFVVASLRFTLQTFRGRDDWGFRQIVLLTEPVKSA
jgi:hypothetical protein